MTTSTDILADLPAVTELPIRGAAGLAQRLDEHRDTLELSRQLATIRCDLDLALDLDELRPADPDLPRLREIYERLELRRLLDALPAEADNQDSPAAAAGRVESRTMR